MTEKEIEDVKIVAKFMDLDVTDLNWHGHVGIVFCDKDGNIDWSDDITYYNPMADWSQLMPVVEKIEQGNYGIKQCRKVVEIYYDNTKEVIIRTKEKSKIDSLWLAIVSFIKWDKTQK